MISKNLVKSIRSLELKKNRKRDGLFVAEGPKVIEDLAKHYTPHTVVVTPGCLALAERLKIEHPSLQIVLCENEELQKTSFLQHPQHILATFCIPETANIDVTTLSDKLSIALDEVQDPGNLGTIIRIADWFGIDTIICSHNTADVYNPKVVQATMGSLARVNVIYTDLETFLPTLSADTPIYGMLLDGENIYSKKLEKRGVIVMGNEGNGISPAIRKLVTDRLLIPNYRQGDSAESLNVAIATAITCAEFLRR